MIDHVRFKQVQAEWHALHTLSPVSLERFALVKRQADALVDQGLWVSGPPDMLRVLRRHRDELFHSRLLAWLIVPTNRHALGRAFLVGLADRLWPEEGLLRSGPVTVETEVPGEGVDESGQLRAAIADIVIRGDDATIIIENKVDAGEQPNQCERLYWAFASHEDGGDVRWVFLTPSGRAPRTAPREPALSAWRTMGYGEVRDILDAAIRAASANNTTGRSTATQYLATLMGAIAR